MGSESELESNLRVLGVDPGSRFMGFGVVEERRGRLVHVGHGVIKVDPDAPLHHRLMVLHADLTAALKQFRPQAVAVEGVFTFRNARSALVLGHARGVALLAAAQAGLAVYEYPPARVKRSVGAGGADGKDAVARMVCSLLKIDAIERADASDALAVALCHLNQGRAAGLMVGSGGGGSSSRRRKGAAALLADRLSPSYRRPEAR
jgi:crossover junction endodeoxyribonuclease RuvC